MVTELRSEERAQDTTAVAQPKSLRLSLVNSLPLSAIMLLASPYLAGKDATSAIEKGHAIYSRNRFTGTLDILGEDAASGAECEQYVEMFLNLIDVLVDNPLAVSNAQEQLTVSMKPSMFSTVVPTKENRRQLEAAFERINRVVEYAFKRNVRITLEAEDNNWADFQLESYFALIAAGYSNLGTVLQTRLFRVEKDIARFDERMRVRLVIGIYEEPANIAFTDKRIMKDRLVKYSGRLLEQGTYVELGTHDIHTVERFFGEVVIPNQVPPSRFETQFLLGVPRAKLQKQLINGELFQNMLKDGRVKTSSYLDNLITDGSIVRMYLPFGQDKIAAPYCRRRLMRNPNLVVYGIRNLLHLV